MRFSLNSIAAAMLLTLGLAACGNGVEQSGTSAPAASQPSTAGQPPAAGASEPLAQLASEIRAASEGSKAGADNEQNSGPVKAFTAYGVGKTAWRAVVRGEAEAEGNKLTLEGENIDMVELDATRSAYAKGVEFTADAAGVRVNLNIRSQTCKDDQGNTTEFTATLDYGKQTFKGCAVAGAQEHAPT